MINSKIGASVKSQNFRFENPHTSFSDGNRRTHLLTAGGHFASILAKERWNALNASRNHQTSTIDNRRLDVHGGKSRGTRPPEFVRGRRHGNDVLPPPPEFSTYNVLNNAVCRLL